MPSWNEPISSYPDAWILGPILTCFSFPFPELLALWFSAIFLLFYCFIVSVLYAFMLRAGWSDEPNLRLAIYMWFSMIGLARANVAIAKLMFFQMKARHLPEVVLKHNGTIDSRQ